jgi:hypothetical protein
MRLMEEDDHRSRGSPRYSGSTKRDACIRSIDVKVIVEVYGMGQGRDSVYRIPDVSINKFFQVRLKDLNPKQLACYYLLCASPTSP